MKFNDLSPELRKRLRKEELTLIDGEFPILQNEKYRFEWEDIGESILGGDYDPDDPEDKSALRFYVSRLDDDDPEYCEEVDDGSFCTYVTDDTPFEELVVLLLHVYEGYYPKLLAGESCKKVGELLSWLGCDSAVTKLIAQELKQTGKKKAIKLRGEIN
jgi:hypothetical protein